MINQFGKWDSSQVLTQGDLSVMLLGLELRRHQLRWWNLFSRADNTKQIKTLEHLLKWIDDGKPTTSIKVLISRGAI